MKLYKFFTDIHEGGPSPIEVKWEYGPDAFYLGDNIDVRWWKPWEPIIRPMQRIVWFYRKFKGRFVRGNHELNVIDAPDWITHDGILMTHGDHLFWGNRHAEKYRTKGRGFSRFKRWLSAFISCTLSEWFQAPVTGKFLNRAAKCAKAAQCHTVVCGHWHPKRVREFRHQGVRIIILPRGRTDLYL